MDNNGQKSWRLVVSRGHDLQIEAPSMPIESDDVLTIDELSEYPKISKSTLYKLAQEGALAWLKVGKHWRFHKDAIDDWPARRTDITRAADNR